MGGWGVVDDPKVAEAHAALDAMGIRKHPDLAQRVLWLQEHNHAAAAAVLDDPERQHGPVARLGIPRC